MDIAAAKTFLEIVKTGSFVNAATNLHVTQTAISARIRVLEEDLGCRLFIRTKTGVTLTQAGQSFIRYASIFVQNWERARRSIAIAVEQTATVTLGAELIVSNPMVQNWLRWMRTQYPDHAVRAQIDYPVRLIEELLAGRIDLAVVYGSRNHPDLVAEVLIEEKLVLVEVGPEKQVPDTANYVAIDWGESFAQAFRAAFPEHPHPSVTVNFGPVALDYLLSVGGTAYLRMMVAKPLLAAGRARLVGNAPQFPYSIHALYSAHADESVIQLMRQAVRAALL
ncbi:MAG: LysR family transcriptional regulator [Rhodospirillales bacterium]|nr:LysR family transcriptional regulator [Rhodospirillales bacterium]